MKVLDLPGFTNGYGGLETVRLKDGVPLLLPRHIARLRRTCAFLGLDWTMDEDLLREQIATLIAEEGCRDGRLNIYVSALTLTGSGTDTVLRMRPLPDAIPFSLSLYDEDRERPAFFAHKTMATAIHWAPFPLLSMGTDVLKFSPSGQLLETRFATVFLYVNGRWVTPGNAYIVPGITRGWLLDYLPQFTAESALTRADLAEAEDIFVCNAIRGIQTVIRVEGYPHLKSGAHTDDVRRFYEAARATGFDAFP
ncbi:MAG: aminotransferase class IV [Candidatus Margulisiibacteriota bacterium]